MASLKDLLDKADGPVDIAAIVLGASVGGTVDLVAMLHGVPTLGGAAILGAGYGFGAVQATKAFFRRRRRPLQVEEQLKNQQKIAALESDRARAHAQALLDLVSSGTFFDPKLDELKADITKEILLFDHKLASAEDLAAALTQLTDRTRELKLRHKSPDSGPLKDSAVKFKLT